jgi:ABC-type dipeptide/oligopeptide/nickel transport system ATPase component
LENDQPDEKENCMKCLSLVCVCLTLLALGGRTLAQPAANSTPAAKAPEAQTIALEFDRIEIQRVAESLSERTHKSVLLDSTVKSTLPVTLASSAKTIEEALDRLTLPLGLTWKKIYVMKSAAPANGEQIAHLVEAVKEVSTPGLVVEDPAAHRVTLYLRDLPAAPDLEAQIHAAWPFLRPVYLLSNPKAAVQKPEKQAPSQPTTPEQFAAMERQRMDMFMKLSPDERAKAIQQSMGMVLQTDPAAMQEMMRTGMQAWMQTMQQMTPEQRQQMLSMSMQMMQSIPPETWQNLFQMFRPAPGR